MAGESTTLATICESRQHKCTHVENFVSQKGRPAWRTKTTWWAAPPANKKSYRDGLQRQPGPNGLI